MLYKNLKALSLKQPFAEMIMMGKKTIELRTWNTSYRGYFFVHASLNPYRKGNFKGIDISQLERGVIVGIAEIINVKKYISLESYIQDKDLHCASNLSDFQPPIYGYLLRNVHRIVPIQCKGKLNFFYPECDLSNIELLD